MTHASRPRHPVTGRRFWLRANSARELDAYLHRLDTLRTELRLGVRSSEAIDRELRHLRHGPVTLERAAVAYLERRLAPNTRRGLRSLMATHLKPLLSKPLVSLDAPTVAAWIGVLEHEGLRSSTIGTAWRKLSAIARFALERGWIGSSPWGHFKPRIRGRESKELREGARSVDELVRLLEAAAALDQEHEDSRSRFDWIPPMIEATIACAALLGLRQGELAGLRWSDLATRDDQDAAGAVVRVHLVHLVRQWENAPLKNKRPIWLETIAELAGILERHAARLLAARLFALTGPVFPCRSRSTPGSPRAYLRGEVLTRLNLRAAVRRAGLPNIGSWSAHSLRDTFVTLEASASGGDLARVQLRSRHASVASLSRYLRALQRNNPASPAVVDLPRSTGDAGAPLLGPHKP